MKWLNDGFDAAKNIANNVKNSDVSGNFFNYMKRVANPMDVANANYAKVAKANEAAYGAKQAVANMGDVTPEMAAGSKKMQKLIDDEYVHGENYDKATNVIDKFVLGSSARSSNAAGERKGGMLETGMDFITAKDFEGQSGRLGAGALRAGAGLVVAGSAVRMATGGTPVSNKYGERDIAGLPFI